MKLETTTTQITYSDYIAFTNSATEFKETYPIKFEKTINPEGSIILTVSTVYQTVK